MLSLMQFAYFVPVVLAVVIAGVLVGRNVTGRARGLLWTGIALVIVAQSLSLVAPLLLRWVRTGWVLSAFSMASLVVSVTGIVLLIVAVGQAARSAAPVHPGPPDYRYPAGPTPNAGYPQPGFPPAQQGPYGSSTPPPGASPWGTPGQ